MSNDNDFGLTGSYITRDKKGKLHQFIVSSNIEKTMFFVDGEKILEQDKSCVEYGYFTLSHVSINEDQGRLMWDETKQYLGDNISLPMVQDLSHTRYPITLKSIAERNS